MSKQPTPTAPPHPVTFDEFDAIYRAHLADEDRPKCETAYLRTEADIFTRTGARRWKNYQTFVNTRTRRNREQKNGAPTIDGGRGGDAMADKKNAVPNYSKTEIKCQFCDTVLYTVPRGDLRTIIPQMCAGCIGKVKNLIAEFP